MMTEHPMLFTAPMVRAIIDGTKTQTRRIVKPQPSKGMQGAILPGLIRENDFAWPSKTVGTFTVSNKPNGPDHWALENSPYGIPGDRLWVRETYFAWGRWETRFSAKKGRDEWHFIDMTIECEHNYLYAADGVSNTRAFIKRRNDALPMYWQRPSIFMPRHASRITLEITGLRVQRLNDISEADAQAEGAPRELGELERLIIGAQAKYRSGFVRLWQSINGPGSWDENPWAWVIEFRRTY